MATVHCTIYFSQINNPFLCDVRALNFGDTLIAKCTVRMPWFEHNFVVSIRLEMSFRTAVILLFVAVAAAFKRTPMQMNLGNKIAASLAGALMILPTSAFAGNLEQQSPVAIEKKARFYIGAGIKKDSPVVNEKKARFYIGAGIHKNALLTALAMDMQSPIVVEKKARFYIGAGIKKDSPVVNEKKARFYIGAGIHKDDAALLEKKARFYIGAGIH